MTLFGLEAKAFAIGFCLGGMLGIALMLAVR